MEHGGARGEVRLEELTRGQQVVVRRTAEAKATVPEFFLQAEVDMGRATDLLAGAADPAPTVGDLVALATARALRETPRANGAFRDGRVELYSRVNVGLAVTTGDGVAVPTVFDADALALADLAREARRLAEAARAGTLAPAESRGATCTVWRLGERDVTRLVPIIVAPQAAAVAAGEVRETPVVRDGAVVPGRRMDLTLVCDHRILFGAVAAAFLGRIRALLEDPARLA